MKEAWNFSHGTIISKLQQVLNKFHLLGNKRFGIIPRKIKETQQQLQFLINNSHKQEGMNLIKHKEKELDELLECEEIWWSQRSKTMWLQHGDKNTKLFHQKTSQRRKKNMISSIIDQ